MTNKSDNEFRRKSGTVRIEDVAKLAGVSAITVSRTLHDPSKVREKTRKKVEKAVAKTGYVTNTFASSLKSGRSSIISMFVNDLKNEHFARAIRGCAEALEGSGYHLLMAQTNYSDPEEHDILNSVLPLRPAALVYTGVVRSDDTKSKLINLNIPVMEMWDFTPDPIDMLVGFSNFEGGRLIGQHFGERGFKKIVYAGRTVGRGELRLQGFREALAGFGIPVSMVLPQEGARSISDGKNALATILAEMPDCDAIFFGTDTLALGALFESRARGISVPAELAIAGFGDLDVSSQLSVPLTTIHVSGYEMGLEAGKNLLNRLKGEPIANKCVLYPVNLEIRGTT